MVKETPIKDRIMSALRHRGAYVVKIHGTRFGKSGTPDLLVCYRSIFVGMEVKSPSVALKPSPLQKQQLHKIARAQGIACVVNSVPMAMGILDNIDMTIAGIPAEGGQGETQSKKEKGDQDGSAARRSVAKKGKEVQDPS